MVQLAADIIFSFPVKVSSLTPYTIVLILPAGADIITFLAPAIICLFDFSSLVKNPVHSSTTSTSSSFHGKFSGSLSLYTLIFLPSTIMLSSSYVILSIL